MHLLLHAPACICIACMHLLLHASAPCICTSCTCYYMRTMQLHLPNHTHLLLPACTCIPAPEGNISCQPSILQPLLLLLLLLLLLHSSCTMHHALYTMHHAPCTIHHAPCTVNLHLLHCTCPLLHLCSSASIHQLLLLLLGRVSWLMACGLWPLLLLLAPGTWLLAPSS